MSEFCYPDGKGKAYCVRAEQVWDEDVGILLANVTEIEYPITYCKTKLKILEENLNDESNVSCTTSTGK